jgi:hypothetical protein
MNLTLKLLLNLVIIGLVAVLFAISGFNGIVKQKTVFPSSGGGSSIKVDGIIAVILGAQFLVGSIWLAMNFVRTVKELFSVLKIF